MCSQPRTPGCFGIDLSSSRDTGSGLSLYHWNSAALHIHNWSVELHVAVARPAQEIWIGTTTGHWDGRLGAREGVGRMNGPNYRGVVKRTLLSN